MRRVNDVDVEVGDCYRGKDLSLGESLWPHTKIILERSYQPSSAPVAEAEGTHQMQARSSSAVWEGTVTKSC